MARLLRFAALSSLALLALSYLPSQASAVSVEHVGRNIVRAHDMVAKRKRADTTQQKRCPPKSTSTSAKPSATPKVSSNQSSGGDNPSDGGSAVGAAGKVGFGWGGDDQHLHYWKTGLTKTIYNWNADGPSTAKGLGFEYCPMLWGRRNEDDFAANTARGEWDCALGMNEVNEVGQANLSPADGLALWNQYVRPLKNDGYKLCSPSFSSRPTGMAWLHEFLKLCGSSTCDFDAICFHWYDTTVEKFQTYVEGWHSNFPQSPLWITEYACQDMNGNDQCSKSYVWEFHQTVAGWMNKQSYIHKYMAFGVLTSMDGVNPDNQMMDPSTQQPNDLGEWYITQ